MTFTADDAVRFRMREEDLLDLARESIARRTERDSHATVQGLSTSRKDSMPQDEEGQRIPAMNPHRNHYDNRAATPAATPYHEGFRMRDLERLLAFRADEAASVAAAAARAQHAERLPEQLAAAYDDGWRAGMTEQHDALAHDFGERLHGLHEMLSLLPHAFASYEGMAERFADFLTIASAVTGSVMEDHARGPFAVPSDIRAVPTPSVPLREGGDPTDALRDRVEQLRAWLKPFFDRTMPAREREAEMTDEQRVARDRVADAEAAVHAEAAVNTDDRAAVQARMRSDLGHPE